MQKRTLVGATFALLVIVSCVAAFAAAPAQPLIAATEAGAAVAGPVAGSAMAVSSTFSGAATSEAPVPQGVLDLARQVKGSAMSPEASAVDDPPSCPINSTCGTPGHCVETTCGSHTDTGISTCRLQSGWVISCINGATIHTWGCACATTCNPPCLCALNDSHWACEGGSGEDPPEE